MSSIQSDAVAPPATVKDLERRIKVATHGESLWNLFDPVVVVPALKEVNECVQALSSAEFGLAVLTGHQHKGTFPKAVLEACPGLEMSATSASFRDSQEFKAEFNKVQQGTMDYRKDALSALITTRKAEVEFARKQLDPVTGLSKHYLETGLLQLEATLQGFKPEQAAAIRSDYQAASVIVKSFLDAQIVRKQFDAVQAAHLKKNAQQAKEVAKASALMDIDQVDTATTVKQQVDKALAAAVAKEVAKQVKAHTKAAQKAQPETTTASVNFGKKRAAGSSDAPSTSSSKDKTATASSNKKKQGKEGGNAGKGGKGEGSSKSKAPPAKKQKQ